MKNKKPQTPLERFSQNVKTEKKASIRSPKAGTKDIVGLHPYKAESVRKKSKA